MQSWNACVKPKWMEAARYTQNIQRLFLLLFSFGFAYIQYSYTYFDCAIQPHNNPKHNDVLK